VDLGPHQVRRQRKHLRPLSAARTRRSGTSRARSRSPAPRSS
jgi:hypothetical protein